MVNRPGLSLAERTEYYDGTGTQKLLLRNRPIPTPTAVQVWTTQSGYWGSVTDSFSSADALTYGVDFAVRIDQPDGSSRSGILLRIGNYWERPTIRSRGLLSPYLGEGNGNIKVTYTGGYTVDTLPSPFRLACVLLVSRLRYIFPLGVELGSEGYEERSISVITSEKTKLLALVMPLLRNYRNWKW